MSWPAIADHPQHLTTQVLEKILSNLALHVSQSLTLHFKAHDSFQAIQRGRILAYRDQRCNQFDRVRERSYQSHRNMLAHKMGNSGKRL